MLLSSIAVVAIATGATAQTLTTKLPFMGFPNQTVEASVVDVSMLPSDKTVTIFNLTCPTRLAQYANACNLTDPILYTYGTSTMEYETTSSGSVYHLNCHMGDEVLNAQCDMTNGDGRATITVNQNYRTTTAVVEITAGVSKLNSTNITPASTTGSDNAAPVATRMAAAAGLAAVVGVAIIL